MFNCEKLKHMNPVKLVALLISIIFLSVSTPLSADTESHAKDKAFLKTAMQKMDKATKNKDLEGYLVFLHPNYVNVNAAGVETAHSKTEMQEQMNQLFSRAVSVTVDPSKITHITFNKKGATVYETGSLSMTFMVNGQKSVLQAGGNYQDFWVKTATGWLEKRSACLSSKTTLNGKPVR